MCGTRLQSRRPGASGLDAALTEGLIPYELYAVERSLEACRDAVTCMLQRRGPEPATHAVGDGM